MVLRLAWLELYAVHSKNSRASPPRSLQSRHTWKVASNVPKGATDADGLRVMVDVRVATAELLVKYGKYPIISEHLGDTAPAQQAYITQRMAHVGYFRYFEFFQPKQGYIEALINETQTVTGVAHPPSNELEPPSN